MSIAKSLRLLAATSAAARYRLAATFFGFTLFFVLISHCSAHRDVYCRSLDIRNRPGMAFQDMSSDEKWSTLSNCTVMEGDFSVSMITSPNFTHESFPIFENLRVITGHLLVFQVIALRSLRRMFPNLRVIGGEELIMNYALVIYQNTHLVEVGLPKLTTILQGGVRIMENTQLCYSRYIDWSAMLYGSANDIMVDQSKATDSDLCSDECVPVNGERCHRVDGTLSCWDAETCQLQCPYARNADKSPGPGCDEDGEKCDDQCLGGCAVPNDPSACHFCRNVIYNGQCIEKCPDGLLEVRHVYMVRRCVTVDECKNISAPVTAESSKKQMLVVGNMCRVDCPYGQEIDPRNSSRCVKCKEYCPVKCKGGNVDALNRINDYRAKNCNVIEGYLEIELRLSLDENGMRHVAEAFGSIEVIEGYLLIDFSTSFLSLHMFKRLRLIKGNTLWRDRYALAVFENHNLRQAFDIEQQPLKIGNGTVFFQNNRMLCYRRITELIDHLGLTDVKDMDVSTYSNGERAICDEALLEVQTDGVFPFGFLVSWVAFNTTDLDQRKFLGYQVFYKKVMGPDPNMTIDDDRSACADSWNMHFEAEKGNAKEGLNRGTGIFGVDANTWYAYYVQTKLINHQGARNAISKIQFVKTTFANPDPPKDVRGRSNRADQMELEWELPEKTNGDISHYMVKWQVLADDSSAMAGHICEDKPLASRRPHKEIQQRMSLSVVSTEQPTCSKQPGCCDCNAAKKSVTSTLEDAENERRNAADFENAVQNIVFVQHDNRIFDSGRRVKRSSVGWSSVAASGRVRTSAGGRGSRRVVRSIAESSNVTEMQSEKQYGDQDAILITENEVNESLSMYRAEVDTATHKINVTTRRLTITGLRHYTQYQIWIHACQNHSEPGGSCSQRPGWMVVRTASIPDNDLVDNSTIELINATLGEDEQRARKITWAEPGNPNGIVLAYKVTLTAEDRDQTPISMCVKAADFRRDGGVTFVGLPEGIYQVEIRTISLAALAGTSTNEVALVRSLFVVRKPTFFTWRVILMICGITFLVLSIGALIVYYFSRKLFVKKAREYLRQQISANPEYLSQMDVYKPDEWELKRSDIHLEEEIGRGTFGKVYRGYANDLVSHGGVQFGECAVKTVAEGANNAERLHFLIEASVMKQFHTSFIVKLYGVVSDGQPVLVVMELMKKGNLRDYLRSRRPNAEENKGNMPIPTHREYVRWAAQIADGMAYLESLKFCHRDLAARNCMVHEDDSVKIGDFGMARDIYYHEYYKPTGKRLMPVRWMAPESLKDGKFTMKSDVWSYGIVLYEMLTLAQQPYSGIGNEEVFNYIGVSRRILTRPTDCPDFWYDLMVQCWKYDPRDRPDFSQIVRLLMEQADEDFIERSFVASTIGRMNYSESEGNEAAQQEEAYHPAASDESGLVMSADVIPDDQYEEPVCSSNRRISSNWRRAESEGDEERIELELRVPNAR